MISLPRFLKINDKYSLVMVRYKDGKIDEVSGPIQLAEAETPDALIKTVDAMLGRALHEAPALLVSDLPDEIQKRYLPVSA